MVQGSKNHVISDSDHAEQMRQSSRVLPSVETAVLMTHVITRGHKHCKCTGGWFEGLKRKYFNGCTRAQLDERI